MDPIRLATASLLLLRHTHAPALLDTTRRSPTASHASQSTIAPRQMAAVLKRAHTLVRARQHVLA